MFDGYCPYLMQLCSASTVDFHLPVTAYSRAYLPYHDHKTFLLQREEILFHIACCHGNTTMPCKNPVKTKNPWRMLQKSVCKYGIQLVLIMIDQLQHCEPYI